MEKFNANINFSFNGDTLYIASEGSSGCEYHPKSKQELLESIVDYVMDEFDKELCYKASIVRNSSN